MGVTTDTSALRRRPAQRRSAERVQRMLDACADILDESGYDGLSTTKVAQRADVAIGSVYQFFPDKKAVAQELALRNLEHVRGAGGARPWPRTTSRTGTTRSAR